MSEMTIETGSIRDFDALAEFHYRNDRPATIAAVYRAVTETDHALDPCLARELRLAGGPLIAGVLVVSMPHLGCAMRERVLGGRYRGLSQSQRARAINREVRTISRVVVDPRFRGQGIAVALVRYALERAETPITEALAAMGRVHPFFEKAGMARFDPPPHPADERLVAALERCGIAPYTLASARAFTDQLEKCSPSNRAWLERELERWCRRCARTRSSRRSEQTNPLGIAGMIRAARQRIFARPIYYVRIQNAHGQNARATMNESERWLTKGRHRCSFDLIS